MAASQPADLFAYAERYPDAPGYRRTDTSRAAAQAIAPRVGTLQARVLEALKSHGPLASFELADVLRVSYRSIQPRTSELRNARAIVDSGERRTDPDTGRDAIVWGLA